ncbi:hypothetical protein A2U01_0099094, partial [Trifolium medium]|nr:hypothetical protein [Trifolium medium]
TIPKFLFVFAHHLTT